jgi:hypothetical protein
MTSIFQMMMMMMKFKVNNKIKSQDLVDYFLSKLFNSFKYINVNLKYIILIELQVEFKILLVIKLLLKTKLLDY